MGSSRLGKQVKSKQGRYTAGNIPPIHLTASCAVSAIVNRRQIP